MKLEAKHNQWALLLFFFFFFLVLRGRRVMKSLRDRSAGAVGLAGGGGRGRERAFGFGQRAH